MKRNISTEYLNNQIHQDKKKNLFILRGFNFKQISKLEMKFHIFGQIEYTDFFEMLSTIEQAGNDSNTSIKILQMLNEDNLPFVWITYEEYLAFSKHELLDYFDLTIINNNIFYNLYPISLNIPDIKNIYSYGFLDDENDLDEEQSRILKKVTKVYGQIYYNSLNNQYYFSYVDNSEKIGVIDFYSDVKNKLEEIEMSESIEKVFSLTDSEDQILDLTAKLGKIIGKVYIAFDSDDMYEYHDYKERISILNSFSNENQIFIVNGNSPKREIKNQKEYLDVLDQYWGYKEFREIPMYADPKRSKKLIQVSQVQIIDDIVKQTEIGLSNKQPRDVFITASTGAGKSVMFQLPSFYISQKYNTVKPLTIVIQPLIGLMNDQVQSLKEKGVNSVTTINSSIDPLEKEKRIERVQNGEIDILYISTETLQNKSDIKILIGDRTIGLFIVDEAHTVTTWGKTFRADYWYMGLYLSKLRKEYKFPIVTFTATAIYGGPEDMYRETVDSLNLIEPITYLGYTKRDNIYMMISHKSKTGQNEYLKIKQEDLFRRISYFVKNKQKSLVYFPTVKSLNGALKYIDQKDSELFKNIRKYYGPLNPTVKQMAFNDFKDGKALIIFATKAFGMGIDIPDITNIYHYSPTGDVVDYIQEVGRAARKKELVPKGYAGTLFLPNDMNSIKQLHGMSAIRKPQLINVMKKIILIYRANGYNRNLIISADDFRYVLQLNDHDDLDNKIKIILLMIEKDFEQSRLGYAPFVARPKPVFGNELVFMNPDVNLDDALNEKYGKYLKKKYDFDGSGYKAIYDFNLEHVWADNFKKKLGYPAFKAQLFTNDDSLNIHFRNFVKNNLKFATGIDITFAHKFTDARARYKIAFSTFKEFLREYVARRKTFNINDLATYLRFKLKLKNSSEGYVIANAIINASMQIASSTGLNFIVSKKGSQTGLYQANNSYFQLFDLFDESLNRIFDGNLRAYTKDSIHVYYHRLSNRHFEKSHLAEDIAVLGIGESMEELTYEIKNGNNPQIYLRINSTQSLERAVENPDGYHNELLQRIQRKYRINVAFLTYLFTHEEPGEKMEKVNNYSEWFWNEIEKYFLGKIPEKVLEKADDFK